MEFVANREIYNFRRVPGSGFCKGVEIKMMLTLVWVTNMTIFVFDASYGNHLFCSAFENLQKGGRGGGKRGAFEFDSGLQSASEPATGASLKPSFFTKSVG